MDLLYTPVSGKKMNCIGFASGSGTNLRALHRSADGYILRGVFVDRPCPSVSFAKEVEIPCLEVDDETLRGNGRDVAIAEKVQSFQVCGGFFIDAIFLAGYMKIITKPLLDAFPLKILNVHPADLSVLDVNGRRMLTGRNAVLKALLIGKREVHSAVHLVSAEMDAGPVLVTSKALKVSFSQHPQVKELLYTKIFPEVELLPVVCAEGLDYYVSKLREERPEEYRMLHGFSKFLQEEQKVHCDWPAYIYAAQNMAKGRFSVSIRGGNVQLYLDGKELSDQGCVL